MAATRRSCGHLCGLSTELCCSCADLREEDDRLSLSERTRGYCNTCKASPRQVAPLDDPRALKAHLDLLHDAVNQDALEHQQALEGIKDLALRRVLATQCRHYAEGLVQERFDRLCQFMVRHHSVRLSSYICPICFQNHTGPGSALKCGHVFCGGCAKEVCDRRQPCPLCRTATGVAPLTVYFN